MRNIYITQQCYNTIEKQVTDTLTQAHILQQWSMS